MRKQTKNILIILNVILAVFIFIMDIIMCALYNNLIYKQIASAGVCALAIINFVFAICMCKKQNFTFHILILLGILLGCAGDFFINYNFILGGVLFAIGHLIYIVALYFICKFKWQEIIIAIILVAVSLIIVFVPYVNYGQYLIIIVVYAVILSLMFAKCFSNFILNKKTVLNFILVIAGLLFYLSDLMLLLYTFKNASIIFDKLCLLLYLPAQILFCNSILISTIKQNK